MLNESRKWTGRRDWSVSFSGTLPIKLPIILAFVGTWVLKLGFQDEAKLSITVHTVVYKWKQQSFPQLLAHFRWFGTMSQSLRKSLGMRNGVKVECNLNCKLFQGKGIEASLCWDSALKIESNPSAATEKWQDVMMKGDKIFWNAVPNVNFPSNQNQERNNHSSKRRQNFLKIISYSMKINLLFLSFFLELCSFLLTSHFDSANVLLSPNFFLFLILVMNFISMSHHSQHESLYLFFHCQIFPAWKF